MYRFHGAIRAANAFARGSLQLETNLLRLLLNMKGRRFISRLPHLQHRSWNISRCRDHTCSCRDHSNRSSHCWLPIFKTWGLHGRLDRNMTFCQGQDLIYFSCRNETFGSSLMVGVGHDCDNLRLQTARSPEVHYDY